MLPTLDSDRALLLIECLHPFFMFVVKLDFYKILRFTYSCNHSYGASWGINYLTSKIFSFYIIRLQTLAYNKKSVLNVTMSYIKQTIETISKNILGTKLINLNLAYLHHCSGYSYFHLQSRKDQFVMVDHWRWRWCSCWVWSCLCYYVR